MQRYNKNRYRLHVGSKFIAISNGFKVVKDFKDFKDPYIKIGIAATQKRN